MFSKSGNNQSPPPASDTPQDAKRPGKFGTAFYDAVASFSAGSTSFGFPAFFVGLAGIGLVFGTHFAGAVIALPLTAGAFSTALFAYGVSRFREYVAESFPREHKPAKDRVGARRAGLVVTAGIGLTAAALTVASPKLLRMVDASPILDNKPVALAFNANKPAQSESTVRTLMARPANRVQAGVNLC